MLWCAVDQHGAELDILLQKHRDKVAAKRFFKQVLAGYPGAPKKIVTDQLRVTRPPKQRFQNLLT